MSDVLYYATDSRITPRARDILRRARALAYGEDEVDFVEVEAGVGALCFGFFEGLPDDAVRTMSFREAPIVPHAEFIIAAAMRRYRGTFEYRSPKPGANILWFDTEAHSVDDRWRIPTREYTRLFQYAWNEDAEVTITSDYDEMIELIESADVSVAQQGILFDLSTLYGKDSIRPLELARDGRVFDPKVFAAVNFPAPPWYVNRKGQLQGGADSPGNAKRGWFSLDNLAYQTGTKGKEGDLKALAAEFGGFGEIPLSDVRYRTYAEQDVITLRDMTSALLQFASPDDYDWREMLIESINAQVSRSGFRVNKTRAKARVEELAIRKHEILSTLEADYEFPTNGAMPWRTTAGKKAILDLLSSAGVVPEEDEDWPRTKTGNISLSGEAIIEGTRGTEIEEVGQRLAEIQGQRSLAELTLSCVQPDGRVHPEIDILQKSGRTSVTQPGLTVFNGDEKAYFIPSVGRKLVSVDYSNADARAVAAMSGDAAYAERFAPGVDAHELTGRAAFGDVLYESDPAKYRKASKPISHGDNYQIGSAKLAQQMWRQGGLRVTVQQAKALLDSFHEAYPEVTAWKRRVADEGARGWVTNLWGRKMPVDPNRAWTQAPGLLGQGTTREVVYDGLIRILHHNIEWIRYVAVPVHDEVIWDVPKNFDMTPIIALMETTVNGVDFPVSFGEKSSSWYDCSHA